LPGRDDPRLPALGAQLRRPRGRCADVRAGGSRGGSGGAGGRGGGCRSIGAGVTRAGVVCPGLISARPRPGGAAVLPERWSQSDTIHANRHPIATTVCLSGDDDAPERIAACDMFGGTSLGGSGGIRTHGAGLPYNGFQDRLLRPLGHASLGSSMPVTEMERTRPARHEAEPPQFLTTATASANWPSSKRLSPARSATDTVATGLRRRSVLLALLHPVPLALGAQEVIEHGSAGRCRNFAGTARRLAGPCRGIIAARGRSVGNRFAECAAVTAVMRTLTPGMAELRCVLRLGRLRFVSGAVGVLR